MKKTDLISVWIIEDDEDDRGLIAEAFGESFLQVTTLAFESAVVAAEILQKCIPAQFPLIIVTDFNMPRMTGFEFIDLLHKDNKYNGIIKVVLSTACLPADQQKCMDSGADAYLKKPANYGDLITVTATILALLKRTKTLYR
jgi:CheY-like chemotaxis protein